MVEEFLSALLEGRRNRFARHGRSSASTRLIVARPRIAHVRECPAWRPSLGPSTSMTRSLGPAWRTGRWIFYFESR